MLKLPYCIAIAGLVCALFAFGIPQLSSLRIWLGFSTFFSLIYLVAVSVLSLKDGIAHSIISFFFFLYHHQYISWIQTIQDQLSLLNLSIVG